MPKLMIVDDDQKFLDVLSKLLASRGFQTVTYADGDTALHALEAAPVDLLISDIHMRPMSGLDLLKQVHERYPAMAVIMLTAFGTVDIALECLRMGAFDFIAKPFRFHEFIDIVERALAWDPSAAAQAEQPEVVYHMGNIVAQSTAMREVCTMIERVAPTDATVLFRGERGVGKELAGRTLHQWSLRRERPFVVAEWAKAAPNTVEAIFFGTAGRGGTAPTDGLVHAAQGGTLWLNEIATLPAVIQDRLLRLLKEQVAVRVGATEPEKVDVRIVGATAVGIERAVGQGRFRPDLFARFAPLSVAIKPLRERREDILPLAWHLCRQFLGPEAPLPSLEAGARGIMLHYDWPGNALELQEVLIGILKDHPRATITGRDLPEFMIRSLSSASSSKPPMPNDSSRGRALKAFLQAAEGDAAKEPAAVRVAVPPPTNS